MGAEEQNNQDTELLSGDTSGDMPETPSVKSAFNVNTISYLNDPDAERVIGTISMSQGLALKNNLAETPRDEYVTFVFDDKNTPPEKCPVADIEAKDLYTDNNWWTFSVNLRIENFPPDVAAAASLCGCFNLKAGTIKDEMAASDKDVLVQSKQESHDSNFGNPGLR